MTHEAPPSKTSSFAEVRKTAVAALGLIAQAVSAGMLHGRALAIAEAILGCATVLGVYATPNAKHVNALPKPGGTS